MPLGESGNPRSPYYDDEIAKGIATDTHQPTPLSQEAIAALPGASHLTLRPKGGWRLPTAVERQGGVYAVG